MNGLDHPNDYFPFEYEEGFCPTCRMFKCKEHDDRYIDFPHGEGGEVDDDEYGDFKFHEKRDIEACEREE